MSGPRVAGNSMRAPQHHFGQQNTPQNATGFGFLQCVGTTRRQAQIQRPPEMSSLFGGNQSMHALQVGGGNSSAHALQVDGLRASGASSRARSLHPVSHNYSDRQQTENKVGAWMRMPPRGGTQGMMVAATRIQSLDDGPANRPQGGTEHSGSRFDQEYARDGMVARGGSVGSFRFSNSRETHRAVAGGVMMERDSYDVAPATYQQLRAPESGVSQKELLPRETRDKNHRLMFEYRLRLKRDGSPASSVSASPLGSVGGGGMRSVLGGFRKAKQGGEQAGGAARAAGGGGVGEAKGSLKKKEIAKESEASEPAVVVAAASGEVKIDISKAHSIFYVPCIKKAAKLLPFVDTLPPSTRNDPNATIYWHDRLDVPLTKYHVGRLKHGQRMNRYLTMQYQARKNPLAKKLNRLQQLFPKDYDFHPVSYRFPAEVALFKKNAKKWQSGKDGAPDVGKPVYYILKPDNGSKGQGICLAEYAHVLQKWAQMSLINDDDDNGDDECTEDDVKGAKGKQGVAEGASGDPKKVAAKSRKKKSRLSKKNAPMPNFAAGEGRHIIVQEYLESFLLGGHKFDLRLYVVLASVNPLEVYICRQGMVRRAMVMYETPDDSNIKELHMHLTNTSLNSKFTDISSSDGSSDSSDGGSDDDEEEDEDDEPAACKEYLGIVMDQLGSMGVDTQGLWSEIMRVVSHTMAAIQPELAIAYTSAFMKPENAVNIAKKSRKKKGPQATSPAHNVISNTLDFTRCFQIIGFDVLLDRNCKPYIIEINHNPSFKLPTPIDVDIKVTAMAGCLGIVTDRLMVSPPNPVIIPAVPAALGTEHILTEGGGWTRANRGLSKEESTGEKSESVAPIEWGKELISSRELYKILSYTELPRVPEHLGIFDRVFKLHEAVCTQAMIRSLESQGKGLEEQGKPAMVFGSSTGAASKTARRGLEMLSPAELRDKDAGILQDLLARARLPKGVAFDTRTDFKAVFPLSRTTVAHVLVVDGLCDGLVELANLISKSVAAGNFEPRPAPKGAMDIELGSWEGSSSAGDALVTLVARLFLVL